MYEILEVLIDQIITFFTIDRTIGIAGIAVTAGVAYYIYRIQKNAQEKVNKIINQQSQIIKSIQVRREDRVRWMSDHLVMLLQSLRKNYTDIISKVEEYEADKTEENFRKITVLSRISVTMTLQQLIDIADRDIAAAKDFISNSWLAVKFQDNLHILGSGVPLEESKIWVMDSNRLFEYKNNIREHIKNIDYYIETIQNELKDEEL